MVEIQYKGRYTTDNMDRSNFKYKVGQGKGWYSHVYENDEKAEENF